MLRHAGGSALRARRWGCELPWGGLGVWVAFVCGWAHERRPGWFLWLFACVGVRVCVCGVRFERLFDNVGHANWCPIRLDSPCLGVCIVKPSARSEPLHQKGSQQ
nr:MAG TPA: hypothetical protein [Caudoviricetes sp.]